MIPSRNACRDKNRGAGPSVAAKCRTVVLGCLDPDLSQLDRSSPTPTKFADLWALSAGGADGYGVGIVGEMWLRPSCRANQTHGSFRCF